MNQNANVGGWNFLQSLGNNTSSLNQNRSKTEHAEKIYVHPLVKRSFSKLSDKSLEMCTEGLGSESGSESGDEISLLLLEPSTPVSSLLKPQEEEDQDKDFIKRRTIRRPKIFPPPIKSMSGSNSSDSALKLASFREDGRLVLRAVRVSPPGSRFQAERTDGRLRLFALEGSSVDIKDEKSYEVEIENKKIENSAEILKDEPQIVHSFEEDEKFVEETEEEAEDGVNGNTDFAEGNLGTQKFRRLSRRCEDGGREQSSLINWEQCWVAT